LRTQKIVKDHTAPSPWDSQLTTYHYQSGQLQFEHRYKGGGNHDYAHLRIRYLYNSDGVCALRVIKDELAPVPYLLTKDLLGNVVQIKNAVSGAVEASYEYDAWGNHRIFNGSGLQIFDSREGIVACGHESNIGVLNPIRYRGYYYDTEIELYYLKSRYYDSETGRFVNADSPNYLNPTSPSGLNLYAYCGNDPINYSDYSGCFRVATHERRRSTSYSFEGLNLLSLLWIGWMVEREEVSGGNGFFYSYSKTNIDLGKWLPFELPSVGVGLNFWNAVRIEAGVKFLGVEAELQI